MPYQDALSFGEGHQQLVCFKQNYPLAIAAFPDTSVDYTIPLGINSNKTGAFYFAFSELPLKGYPTNFWLKDTFLGIVTPIDAQTKHYFTITGDTASKGNHRFKLWVQKATVLANSSNIQLKATVLNETICLQWQDNIVTSKEYLVERSADGHHFYPLSSVLSGLTTHYEDDALANHPEQFVFYHRIKVITTTNAPFYSNVVSIQLRPNAAFSARVITSLTEQSLITIQLQNERPNSHFAINIYGVAGKLVKQFVCTDENQDHRLQVSAACLATGMYVIEIVQNQQEKHVLKWWKK